MAKFSIQGSRTLQPGLAFPPTNIILNGQHFTVDRPGYYALDRVGQLLFRDIAMVTAAGGPQQYFRGLNAVQSWVLVSPIPPAQGGKIAEAPVLTYTDVQPSPAPNTRTQVKLPPIANRRIQAPPECLQPGYYYEHVNGTVLSKNPVVVETTPGGPEAFFDSPFVKYWWHLSEKEAKQRKHLHEQKVEELARRIQGVVKKRIEDEVLDDLPL